MRSTLVVSVSVALTAAGFLGYQHVNTHPPSSQPLGGASADRSPAGATSAANSTPAPSPAPAATADTVTTTVSGVCTLYQKTNAVLVYLSGPGMDSCRPVATAWTRTALGTSTFWLSTSGRMTGSDDPGSVDAGPYERTCVASQDGVVATVRDTGAMSLGSDVCAALTSAGWDVR